MSDDTSSNDIRSIQDDLQRLLDQRLSERVRGRSMSPPDTREYPATSPPSPPATPPGQLEGTSPPPSPPAPSPPAAATAPSSRTPAATTAARPAAPTPPARSPATPQSVDADFYGARDTEASRNPGGPRSSIGRKRSSVPKGSSSSRLYERIEELEQDVLRLGLRAETAEEVLHEAERLHEEQIRALQEQVRTLQDELEQAQGGEREKAKGRLGRVFGRSG